MTNERETFACATGEAGRSSLITNGQSSRDDSGDRLKTIQTLNDRLRKEGRGGITYFTEGIASLGCSFVEALMKELAAFDAFTPDNDPWGEHDCAVVAVDGQKILWKRSSTMTAPENSTLRTPLIPRSRSAS